jgi:hypothetical protein
MKRRYDYVFHPQMSAVLSIRDIDYDLNPNACYHSVFRRAAMNRIMNQFNDNPKLQKRIRYAMEQSRADAVWAIVIEKDNKPVYVIQNLAYTNVSPAFRRVIQIQ